jgi:3-methyladenine DNA glycosylase/8-oxoguanine DNA glycosylase
VTDGSERVWRPEFPVDAALTLSALRMGRSDPCHRRAADGSLWRASLMPSGPVTYRLAQSGRHEVRATAWGAGADELLTGLPGLLGAGDRPQEFVAGHPLLEEAVRRLEGLRVPRTGLVLESLVPAILHQKIQGRDAGRSWAELVRRHGRVAPGPLPDLRVPPDAAGWLAVPQWDWRRAGVEPSAVTTIRLAASRSAALERAANRGTDETYRALLSLPGVGRWTAAEVGHRALGDADALSVGDYHILSLTGWALAGGTLGESEVEGFYERWRPHRYRVMRLLELTPWAWPPRRGPRMERPLHRYGPF